MLTPRVDGLGGSPVPIGAWSGGTQVSPARGPGVGGRERGRLVALEGLDGCGKSTQARLLAAALGGLLTFEPGATELGVALRQLLLDTTRRPPVPPAEALLLSADRAQHVAEVIEPALRRGQWVVSDRYAGSTLAYQGWGRGLDVAFLRHLTEWATGGLVPDLTVLIEVSPEVARSRIAHQAPDRLERLEGSFFERVRDGFHAQAAADPVGWVLVDGSGSVEAVAGAVRRAVQDRVGWPRSAGDRPAGEPV